MKSSEKQIQKSIKSRPRGTLVFPDDFANYGSPEAVRKALDCLENKTPLIRVAQGIYVRPKETNLIAFVLPGCGRGCRVNRETGQNQNSSERSLRPECTRIKLSDAGENCIIDGWVTTRD